MRLLTKDLVRSLGESSTTPRKKTTLRTWNTQISRIWEFCVTSRNRDYGLGTRRYLTFIIWVFGSLGKSHETPNMGNHASKHHKSSCRLARALPAFATWTRRNPWGCQGGAPFSLASLALFGAADDLQPGFEWSFTIQTSLPRGTGRSTLHNLPCESHSSIYQRMHQQP